jgi:hypothetical protein
MNTPSLLLQDSLLLIWNNRNSAERLVLMDKTYASELLFLKVTTVSLL